MARAFRAASPLPLPSSSSRSATAASGSGSGSFTWLLKKRSSKAPQRSGPSGQEAEDEGDEEEAGAAALSSAQSSSTGEQSSSSSSSRKKRADALARLRSVFLAAITHRRRRRQLGSCVTGTIFGRRRGRVHVALQTDPRSAPVLLVEMAAYSTGALVREMSSGLVRLALECEKPPLNAGEKRRPLLEEPTWRAYCNGLKCGYAVHRECGADEWRVLGAVEQVSVGAGVLPDDGAAGAAGGASEGDLMYMRAKFERVVGSRDSEAFYMMNPDGSGGPELSIYLLRV
ncbi:protein MIZU-KUSSEI 1-like [Triticum dicoccoides]|uniref:protein MIZU-KUSSEI 1-like n=1 Tax=Triticum dicoccoides TaxID=85692 RepID=UPI000E79D74A|nr:protein MIZU-KUSSEI 1-like [Triticum dicoccoides]